MIRYSCVTLCTIEDARSDARTLPRAKFSAFFSNIPLFLRPIFVSYYSTSWGFFKTSIEIYRGSIVLHPGNGYWLSKALIFKGVCICSTFRHIYEVSTTLCLQNGLDCLLPLCFYYNIINVSSLFPLARGPQGTVAQET